MNVVKTVRTVTVIETITVAAVPMPTEPRPFPRTVKVDLPPVAYTPRKFDRVNYTGPNGTATYKVIWVGYKNGALRVGLVGFNGRVKFFTDASKVSPA